MSRFHRNFTIVLVVVAVALPAVITQAAQPVPRDRNSDDIPDSWTRAQVSSFLKGSRAIVELADASIIIEVNSTDGDAGFQISLDGEGWKTARVYGPDGRRILKVDVAGGVRNIGGGTELFLESEEPEYETDEDELAGLEDLIELLPEGEYFFLAKKTSGSWATATAELTHDIPAGPVILEPMPVEDGCSAGVTVDSAFIRWDPVEMDIWDEGELDIEGYQVIVEAEEDPERVFMAIVPAETTEVMVPPEVLGDGGEFKFEILAIEESGNQTITESCFEAD